MREDGKESGGGFYIYVYVLVGVRLIENSQGESLGKC